MRSLVAEVVSKAVVFAALLFLSSLMDFREDKHVFLLQNNHPLYVSVIVCICIYIKYILSHFLKAFPQTTANRRVFFCAVLQVWFILLILNGLKHLQKTIQPHKLVRDYGYPEVRRCTEDKPILFIESFCVVSPSSNHYQSSYTHFGAFCLLFPGSKSSKTLFFSRNRNTATSLYVVSPTPLKFNMEPEKKSLEKVIPFGNHHFQVTC